MSRRARTAVIVAGATVSAVAAAVYRRARVRRVPSFPPGAEAITADEARGYVAGLAAASRVGRRDLAVSFAPAISTKVEPLVHGREYFPRMLEDIGAATSSIHLLMYGFKDGDIGCDFRDALVAKAREGVAVRLSVDSIGSEVRLGSKELYRELVDGGIAVVMNEGLFPDIEGPLGGERRLDRRFDDLGHFDHRKMMVVDGRIGYVGGTGIEDHFNDERFYDTMTRVEGPVVAQLQAVFLSTYLYQGGELAADSDALDACFPASDAPPDGGIRTMVLVNVPGEGHHPISDAIEQILESATRRVAIINPYITDHGILDRLVDAAERGAEVVVIVPGKPTPPYPAAAMRVSYRALTDAGIRVLKHPDMAHAKVMRVDDTAMLGGCNLDALSLFHNFELNLLFEDAGVAERVQEHVLDSFEAVSEPVEIPTKPLQRAWNRAMDVLSPLL